MTPESPSTDSRPPFRVASVEDAVQLMELERAASLAALAHVFPADRFPYPDGDVLARWHLVLADPTARVEVVDGDSGLRCLVAHDASGSLRHLAVAPASWGRGLGRAAVDHALSQLRASGATRAQLWCLVDNTRARRLYVHLGWGPTGLTRDAPWPPYPTEMEYALHL